MESQGTREGSPVSPDGGEDWNFTVILTLNKY